MKLHALLLGAGLLLASPATAQTIVTTGSGLAHDCFIAARYGKDPRGGVDVCGESISREGLNNKNRAATYDNRGILLDVLGRTDQAAEDFNRAIALDPSLGDPHVNLGSMLIKKNQFDQALVEINKGLDLGMSFPHIGYYDRAVAEELMGRYADSYHDYKKTLEFEPNFTEASERLKDFTVTVTPGPAQSTN